MTPDIESLKDRSVFDLIEKIAVAVRQAHIKWMDDNYAAEDLAIVLAKSAIAALLKDIQDWQNKYRIIASNDFVEHYARENGVSLDDR